MTAMPSTKTLIIAAAAAFIAYRIGAKRAAAATVGAGGENVASDQAQWWTYAGMWQV